MTSLLAILAVFALAAIFYAARERGRMLESQYEVENDDQGWR